ncbi:hypothetical protein ABLA30_13025 [Xenorhabdus nematophila]|uniref:hypothetical protein n=1 Tax=Xenorhabdus nematophila TaxID=628 RepID=UPI0032B871FD
MNNQTPFVLMANAFRARVVKIWIIRTDLSAAQGAEKLTKTAVEHGFIRRDKPVFGTTLTSWTKGEIDTPLWAAKAALLLLIESGWIPDNDEEWAGFAAIFFAMQKTKELKELLDKLPIAFSSHVAISGWLCAAIEEQERFKAVKQYEIKWGKPI